MMQQSRVCQMAEHYFKPIESICIYPLCQLSRFLCSICLLENLHKHNLQDNSHTIDLSDFYKMIKNKLDQSKGKYEFENQNTIQQVEQSQLQIINSNHLENLFINIQKYGFNQIDEQTLNNVINILEQQQDVHGQMQHEYEQNEVKINDQQVLQVENNQKQLSQKITNAKYQIQIIDNTVAQVIYTGAISNDLKYIVSGGADKLLQIWDYQSNNHIESIELDSFVICCKFTEDSTLLYVGSGRYIYQFDVNDQFKEIYSQDIHQGLISKIYCISNTIILTASWDNSIIKTDINQNSQLLKIQAHNDHINGLDYNQNLNIFVSGSKDQSIKIWEGNNGSLIIEHLCQDKIIRQVLFIIKNNKLISLDTGKNLILWNINFQTQQLEQLQLIDNSVSNISLVLQQQYIITIGKMFIKVYSHDGEFVRLFEHEVDNFCFFNTIQLDSMKAILILGRYKLYVSKLDLD